jgi:succinate dehydrogenase subunit C
MAARRPYVRPMAGWWRRDRFFVKYMARELTAFFVAAYALVLLGGVIRLSQGREAFDGWLESLRSGWSVALHLVLLLVFLYHTYSWFSIMPKTMPPVVVSGRRLPAWAITAAGLACSGVASLILLVLFLWLPR